MKNNGWLIALLVVLGVIIISVGAAFLFKWEFGFSIALTITLGVIAFVIVAFINRNEGQGGDKSKGAKGAAVFFIGATLIALAYLGGQQSDFAPPDHKYPSVCIMPYNVMGKYMLIEDGAYVVRDGPIQSGNLACRGQDFIDTLNEIDLLVSGEDFKPSLEKALKDDLEIIYRAEKKGERDPNPFSNFIREWQNYREAQADEARDRIYMTEEDQKDMFFGWGLFAFVVFAASGILELKPLKFKFIGGAKALLALCVVIYMRSELNKLGVSLSPEETTFINDKILMGFIWGAWSISIGYILKGLKFLNSGSQDVSKDLLKKFSWGTTAVGIIYIIPSALIGISGFINPTTLSIASIPSIVNAIFDYDGLSMRLILTSIIEGFVMGVGIKSLIEGIITLFFGKKVVVQPEVTRRQGGLFEKWGLK